MAAALTQEQIDALRINYENKQFKTISYHILFCKYCFNSLSTENLDVHSLYSTGRCPYNSTGHHYVSEAFVKDQFEKAQKYQFACQYPRRDDKKLKAVVKTKEVAESTENNVKGKEEKY